MGTLTATDPNAGDTFVFSILPGADGALFSIDGVNSDRLVITGETLDYETRSSYSVNVRVTDSAFNTYDETLVISVTDVNEAPSLSLSQYSLTLPEDTDVSGALKLADIIVTDDALGAETLSLSGDDASWFKIVGSELRLRADAPLDFEADSEWRVVVHVDDTTIAATSEDSRLFQLQLTDVNEDPIAGGDQFAIGFSSLTVAAPGVLANDLDPEGTSLSVTLVTPPSNGTVQLEVDGSFTFVPDDGFFGTDQFVYRVEDVTGESSIGVVELTVQIPLQPVSPFDASPPAASTSEEDSTEDPLPDFVPMKTSGGDSSRVSSFPTPRRVRGSDGSTSMLAEPVEVAARVNTVTERQSDFRSGTGKGSTSADEVELYRSLALFLRP